MDDNENFQKISPPTSSLFYSPITAAGTPSETFDKDAMLRQRRNIFATCLGILFYYWAEVDNSAISFMGMGKVGNADVIKYFAFTALIYFTLRFWMFSPKSLHQQFAHAAFAPDRSKEKIEEQDEICNLICDDLGFPPLNKEDSKKGTFRLRKHDGNVAFYKLGTIVRITRSWNKTYLSWFEEGESQIFLKWKKNKFTIYSIKRILTSTVSHPPFTEYLLPYALVLLTVLEVIRHEL